MTNNPRQAVKHLLSRTITILAITLLPCSARLPPWQVFAFHTDSFVPLPAFPSPPPSVPSSPCPSSVPPTWHVTASILADATNDGTPECVLLVWRPWRDWPIQRWSTAPSPIAGFHDAAGDSCHVILLDPRDEREMWAGSALPAPLLALVAGDVDGDGRNEVITIEGDYTIGRRGPATRVDVWRWNGFGFSLEWRSPPGTFHQLRLTDANDDGTLDIVVR